MTVETYIQGEVCSAIYPYCWRVSSKSVSMQLTFHSHCYTGESVSQIVMNSNS